MLGRSDTPLKDEIGVARTGALVSCGNGNKCHEIQTGDDPKLQETISIAVRQDLELSEQDTLFGATNSKNSRSRNFEAGWF